MHHEALRQVGGRVREVSLEDVGAEAPTWRHLLAVHGVLVFPDQHGAGDDALEALLRALGGHPGAGSGPSAVGLLVRAPARRTSSTGPHPHDEHVTRDVVLSDLHRAFETLPTDVRDWLLGRSVRSTATDPRTGRRTVTEHPVFLRHPLTGRVALHLPDPDRPATLSGLPDDVATATLAALVDHASSDDNVLRQPLVDGDVVVWDGWSVRRAAGPAAAAPAGPRP